jgi:hypothetical protein
VLNAELVLNAECSVLGADAHPPFSLQHYIQHYIQHSAFVIQHFFLMGGTGFEPVTAGV